MIKVSVMYPDKPGARFDHDYYRDKHLPLVKEKIGAALTHYTIDKGLSGGAPGSAPPYIAMCHLFFESIEAFQSDFFPQAKAIMADVPNYTDLSPELMVSEVVVG